MGKKKLNSDVHHQLCSNTIDFLKRKKKEINDGLAKVVIVNDDYPKCEKIICVEEKSVLNTVFGLVVYL